MDNNLWSRRANSGKLSLTTPGGASGTTSESTAARPATSIVSPYAKRSGSDNRPNAFAANNQVASASVASPTSASTAFALGSGAFASFGAPAKTPKTPGNPFDSLAAGAKAAAAAAAEKVAKEKTAAAAAAGSVTVVSTTSEAKGGRAGAYSSFSTASRPHLSASPLNAHRLAHTWVFWFRPPITKANGYIEYEKTLHPIAHVSTVEDFFTVYRHLKHPSDLPAVSDYHLFKDGIRPVWEDEINKQGGKWVVRLKKGVADRYWEDLLLAMIGNQFDSDEVCGIVLSVRNGEDIISIWAKTGDGRVLKIRETMKRVLKFPQDTKVDWKSHDESLQQRAAIEESRREKAAASHHHSEKRGGGNMVKSGDMQRQQA